jgi:hypothetical protein
MNSWRKGFARWRDETTRLPPSLTGYAKQLVFEGLRTICAYWYRIHWYGLFVAMGAFSPALSFAAAPFEPLAYLSQECLPAKIAISCSGFSNRAL